MGYAIQAVISKQAFLETAVANLQSACVVPLFADWALIPMTDELLDEIGAAGDTKGFFKLTPDVASWLCHLSESMPVAYVEAEYSGGTGTQGAVVWSDAQQVLFAKQEPNAINAALRYLGIVASASRDEFDTIGLNQHRHTEDWLEEAPREPHTT